MDFRIEEITVKVEIMEEGEETEDQFLQGDKKDDLNELRTDFDDSDNGLHTSVMRVGDADEKFGEEKINCDNIQGAIERNASRHKEEENIPESCSICDKIFKSKVNLHQHIKHIHTDDYIECTKCKKSFKSQTQLKSHTDCTHSKSGQEQKCKECGKVFINKKKLSNHKYYTHATPDESVSCKICKKTFKKQYKLNVHNRQVHSAGRKVSCKDCGKVFKNEMLLRRHSRWIHPPDQHDHQCDECGKHFPSFKHYKKHKDNTHSMPEGLKCLLCERVLANKKSFKRHMKSHEQGKVFPKANNDADLPCSICDKKFATRTSLYWHVEKDHSENYQLKNSCLICSKEFSDHHVLRRHLESVHPIETATCTVCNKTFKSPMNLQSHMRTTHAPPEAARTCNVCHKQFKCAMHLRIHMNAVHPSPHGGMVCDVCKKTFISRRYLAAHKKIHAETRDFNCTMCDKNFKRQVDVNKHIKKVHKKPEKSMSTCLKCHASFTNDDELYRHILSCTESDTEPLAVVKRVTRRKIKIN